MPEPEPLGFRDLLRDFVRPSRSQLVIAAILMILGFLVVTQLQTRATDEAYSSLRRTDLIALLDDLTAESRRLESDISGLEATRRQLESGVDAREVAQAEAARRLEVLGLLGGTLPAEGPGVRITIYDPAGKVSPEMLLNAIEELRDAGAEVLEVNDAIRLVASSWVASGPNGLVIDDLEVTRPITIEAIGAPETLSEAVRFRGGLVSSVEDTRVGGSVTVTQDRAVRIEALHTPRAPRFARPA